ncbi:MAG TPA: transcription termination factor NusA [Candidatus Dojkabacteria bacterium]|nr:transcription termination factor NusA [Candidatus Dojkabacteria bacterium]HQF36347.1 transcription termination factor NusA [Candidatus Dojkabacteria bacterium]
MAVQTELMTAINQIASERSITKEEVIATISESIQTAIKKEYGEDMQTEIHFDENDGSMMLYVVKIVVSRVVNKNTQISVKEAKEIGINAKKDEIVKIELPLHQFGRIAAQAAKNALIQGVRTAEKQSIFKEITHKKGSVVTAKIQRMRGRTAVVEIDKAIGLLTPEEQIPNEYYKLNERYRVLIVGIEEINGQEEILVSRSRNEFLEGLFELEIPEISSGTVVIKKIVRDPGIRSKVAVFTDQEGIDPQGSCIGQRGVRITNIMNELGTEKVDIILWNDNPVKFISNALSPAKTLEIKINNKTKEAKVAVEDDQLSLAIGREGKNVKLAAMLTGFMITITSPTLKGKSISSNAEVNDMYDTLSIVREKIEKEEKSNNISEEENSKSEPTE